MARAISLLGLLCLPSSVEGFMYKGFIVCPKKYCQDRKNLGFWKQRLYPLFKKDILSLFPSLFFKLLITSPSIQLSSHLRQLVIEVILLFCFIYINTREHNRNFWKSKWHIQRTFFCVFHFCTSNLKSLHLKAAVDSWNAIVTDVRNKIAFLRVSHEVFRVNWLNGVDGIHLKKNLILKTIGRKAMTNLVVV